MPHKIMLVEDDQPILDMMGILLKRMGYTPLLVPDPVQALEIVKSDPPTLILLDVMMEPIDGWQFLEKLRGEYGIRDVPVLLFTASPTAEERLETMQDEKIGILQKPVTITELRAGLDKFLGR